MKKTLIFMLFYLTGQSIIAQNYLYIKFNDGDSIRNDKYFSIIDSVHKNNQKVYFFDYPYLNPQTEMETYIGDWITINKDVFVLIDSSQVSSYSPLSIEQLGLILERKNPTEVTEYFDSFEKVFIIEMGLPNNKAKIVHVKRDFYGLSGTPLYLDPELEPQLPENKKKKKNKNDKKK
ncbi:MAG: hypothetical protein SFU27_07050 [Thermonemataceae bacterium]|nr:hypothetical protein [Thermonemataceae bacterium]